MLHIFARKSDDVTYFTNDSALELDELRDGGAGWWLRGEGELSDPDRVAKVFGGSTRPSTVGYDLIFSAPRTISVLLALDLIAAVEVIRSHRLAVKAAVEYLETYALGTRRSIAGETEVIPARWREVASFTHGVNRMGEPHLHDHVLVGATPSRGDRAIDSRGLFAHLEAADALYRSELRQRVGEHTTYIPWRSFSGNELVLGVDNGYRALWSGRSRVRQEKKLWRREEILAQWAKDLEKLQLFGEREAIPSVIFQEHTFGAELSRKHSVYRRTAITAFANAATFGERAWRINQAIDLHLGVPSQGVGVQEVEISRGSLLQLARVRELGPRSLDLTRLAEWINEAPVTKARVVEPGRELDPLGHLRTIEPEGVSLSTGRTIGEA